MRNDGTYANRNAEGDIDEEMFTRGETGEHRIFFEDFDILFGFAQHRWHLKFRSTTCDRFLLFLFEPRSVSRDKREDRSYVFQLLIGEIFIDNAIEVLVRSLPKDSREIETSDVQQKILNISTNEERSRRVL